MTEYTEIEGTCEQCGANDGDCECCTHEGYVIGGQCIRCHRHVPFADYDDYEKENAR